MPRLNERFLFFIETFKLDCVINKNRACSKYTEEQERIVPMEVPII